MIRHRLSRWLPTEETLRGSRGLRWLAPLLGHPGLWRPTRRRIATGAAVGVFFGFLIPVAQIPAAAGVAAFLRANLPVAAVGTLVSNPLTYVPIWVAAHYTGAALLGTTDAAALSGWERIAALGAPMALGAVVFSVVGAVATWLLVNGGWRLAVHLRRRRRPVANAAA